VRVARAYLEQLATDARRLDRESRELDRAGHFALAKLKRDGAQATRQRLAELEAAQTARQASVRFG
jgi:hypothetical protein